MFTNCYETILRYDNNGSKIINIILFKNSRWPVWCIQGKRYTHEFNWLGVVKPQNKLFNYYTILLDMMFRHLPL